MSKHTPEQKKDYLAKTLEMLDYIEKHNNKTPFEINKGVKVVDWSNFIEKHKSVINELEPLTSIWNIHASRVNLIFNGLKIINEREI